MPASSTSEITTWSLVNSCWQACAMASNTGAVSATELLMTFSTSADVRCCSSASLVSLNRRALRSATRRLARQADEEIELAWLERRAAVAPHRHRAEHCGAGQERHHHQALVAAARRAGDLQRPRVGIDVVDQLGLAALQQRADDAGAGLDPRRLDRLGGVTDRDRGAMRAGIALGQEDRAVARLQQVLRVVGDAVHHQRQVERRRQVAADLRERGGFALAPLGLLQQPLRLVEQARVLERDAHAGDDRLEQPDLALAERVLALEALDDDDADDAFGGDDLHRQASTASIRCPAATPAAATSARRVADDHPRSEVTSFHRASDARTGAIVMRLPCSISYR